MMTGYKALNADMTSKYGNMTYEMGKWYEIEGELKMCENGFHFCDTLEKTWNFYPFEGSRFFKVEVDGEVLHLDVKYVAKKIRLVEEIPVTYELECKYNKVKIMNVIEEIIPFCCFWLLCIISGIALYLI